MTGLLLVDVSDEMFASLAVHKYVADHYSGKYGDKPARLFSSCARDWKRNGTVIVLNFILYFNAFPD